MEKVFNYKQNKKTDKGKCQENCSIDIYHYDDTLIVELSYLFTYMRFDENNENEIELKRRVETEHRLSLDLKTSDFHVFTQTTNKGFLGGGKSSNSRTYKNKFSQLEDITSVGFFGGSKKGSSWGARYKKKTEEAWDLIRGIVQPRIKDEYLSKKGYHKVEIDPLYDLIVDFHLDKRNIKGHDLIYIDIQEDYPKQKYLKSNDRKFVPAVLEQYGIKNKQFISSLNKNSEGMPIIIKTLNYFSKLFGENYIDYMNKIDWHLHCYKTPPTKKVHPLKNETEKRNMVKLIQRWEEEGLRLNTDLTSDGTLIMSLYRLFELRGKIEKRGIELKFTATNDSELDTLFEEWESLRKYIQKGYRIRYLFPEDFVEYVEQPIRLGDVIYQPKVLSKEEEFKIEGHIMKNCMGNQFTHGIASIFVSLRKGKRWVDVQYRKGKKTMCYGKANSPTPSDFKSAIDTLNKRMKMFDDVKWVKDKYDLL